MLMMLLLTAVAGAVPARPGFIRTLTLADGTTVEARLVGDEHVHYWLGNDGKAYQMMAGSEVFEEINAEAVENQGRARRMGRNKAIYASTSNGLGQYGQSGLGSVNSIGVYTIPVIMVEFSNKSFKSSTTVQKMTRFYNEVGYHDETDCVGSVRDYFVSQSRGMFIPTFDVVGIVTLDNTYQTYGGGDNPDPYGNDDDPEGLVEDAVAAAISQLGTDFSKYVRTTTNALGTTTGVPLVCILYAGYGQATGSQSGNTDNTVWPCELDCNTTMSGTKFNSFFVGNELYYDGTLMGMGVFCHEMGHALGLPDFYCTNSYDTSHNDPFSNWSIMDTGAYVKDGHAPIGYNAYERSYLGWLDIPTYTPGEGKVLDPYTEVNGTTAVRVTTSSNTEYFILENRQPGTWYPDDMGSGLMVSRIAYDQTAWSYNKVNYYQNKRAKIVTANGASLYYSGDQANLYGNGVNSITSLARYNSGTVDPEISTITKESDGTIILNIANLSNVAQPVFSPEGGTYSDPVEVSISCETKGASIYYTTDESTPTANSTPYNGPVTISTTTTLKAIAIKDGESSMPTTANYVIKNMKFKRVASVNDIVSGKRYVIVCTSKKTAASGLKNNYLDKVGNLTIKDDIITITDDVAVFLLQGSGTTYSFKNEDTNTYLYAIREKILNYSTTAKNWTLADGTEGVIMKYSSYGTMLYNSSSPRFTTYTSSPNASMIQANLYMEYVEPEKVSVTIGNTGYATLYYDSKNLVVPDGVEAYTYYVNNGKLDQSWLYEAGEVIPKATGVVLTGEAGNYEFLVTTQSGDVDEDNLLMGSDEDALTVAPAGGSTDSYKFYKLSLNAQNEAGTLGFYYGAEGGAAFISAAHKAYLAVPADVSRNATFFQFNGLSDGGLPTGIKALGISEPSSAVRIYDLQGRLVSSKDGGLKKGLYIVNGKKYLVK